MAWAPRVFLRQSPVELKIEEVQKRPLPASGGAGAATHCLGYQLSWGGLAVGGRGPATAEGPAIAGARQPFRAPH
jgi:hypothetical protein